MEKLKSLSKLFLKHRGPFQLSNQYDPKRMAHPFTFLDVIRKNLEENFKSSYQLEDYSQICSLIKEKERDSIMMFDIEFSMLPLQNRAAYLNDTLKILIRAHKTVLEKLKKQSDAASKSKRWTETYFPFYTFLELSNRNIFTHFYFNHHSFLNAKNFKYLSSLYNFRAPIKSFKRVRPIPDKKFEELFRNHIIKNGLLPKNTQFRTFKSLFMAEEVKQKMDWQGPLGSLGYFIKQLRDKEAIFPPKEEWKITYEFFTIKGLPVSKTVNVQPRPRQDLQISIDLFVKGMLEV